MRNAPATLARSDEDLLIDIPSDEALEAAAAAAPEGALSFSFCTSVSICPWR
jgi:hypothetical protein